MKKLVIFLLVLTLLMAPMLVAGATYSGVGAQVPMGTYGGTVSGDTYAGTSSDDGARVVFTNDPIYQFTLPTLPEDETDISFVLDPHGIFFLEDEDIEALVVKRDADGNPLARLGHIVNDEWVPLPSAGQVIFHEDLEFRFLNESNFDVGVVVDFAVTSGSFELVGTKDAAMNSEVMDPNVFLGATFNAANANTEDTPFAGDVTLPLSDATPSALFLLEAAEYDDVITTDGVQGVDRVTEVALNSDFKEDTGNGSIMMLSGAVNPAIDLDFDDFDTLQIVVGFTPTEEGLDATALAGAVPFVSPLHTNENPHVAHGLLAGGAGAAASVFIRHELGTPIDSTPTVGWLDGEGNVMLNIDGTVREQRADFTTARNASPWPTIRFNAGDATPTWEWRSGFSAPPAQGAFGWNAAENAFWFNFTTPGWRALDVTVGDTVFTVAIQVT